jgi:ABC-type uncharacterized transport system substrate-binding protein
MKSAFVGIIRLSVLVIGCAAVIGACGNSGSNKGYKLCLVQYIDSPMSDQAREGILAGFKDSGMVEGKDFTLTVLNAQSDISTLNSILDKVVVDGYDLIMLTSTPTLQAAIHKVRSTPVVFSVVADPVGAGAGTSNTSHLPNITGISTFGDYARALDCAAELLPNAHRIGTLFVPGEVNSVYNKDQLEILARQRGMEVITAPIASTNDVSEAAEALIGKQIDVLLQVACNATDAAFPAIGKVTGKRSVPLIGLNDKHAEQGATLVVSRDYTQAGREASALAVRILKGEKPGNIPFAPVGSSHLLLNKSAARACGITIPDELLKKADRVIE